MDSRDRYLGAAALCLVLACSAALAIAGCSGKKLTKNQALSRYSQELRETVSTSVSDERRKAEMLAVVDQLEALQLRFSQETVSFVDSYRKLNAAYDAPRPAFQKLFSDYGAKRLKARDEALALHFHLASLTTVGEWDSIAKAEVKLYEEVSEAEETKK